MGEIIPRRKFTEEERKDYCVAYYNYRQASTSRAPFREFCKANELSENTMRLWRTTAWWKELWEALEEERAEAFRIAQRNTALANQETLLAQQTVQVVNNGALQKKVGEMLQDYDLTPADLQKLAVAAKTSYEGAIKAAGQQFEEDKAIADQSRSHIAIQNNNSQVAEFKPATGGYGQAGDHPAEDAILKALDEQSTKEPAPVVDAEVEVVEVEK